MPDIAEPCALLDGAAAREAVAAGRALWLQGGPLAFALVREAGLVRAPDPARDGRFAAAPPPFAGLPTDRPLVMGILNVTPDSFSDGTLHLDARAAIAAGQAMRAAGVDILDIGGESTRPGAEPVPPEEEQRRILPVIAALAPGGPVSVDTRHAATMRAALAAGARIVNDVTALRHDPDAARVVAEAGAPVILMHMRGEPSGMNDLAQYQDAPAEVAAELADALARAEAAGVARGNIALDPGLGFAKDAPHNLAILARLPLFAGLGCWLALGASRKRFIGSATGVTEAAARVHGSVAAALHAAAHGARILRVHDVAATAQALRVWRAAAQG
jgi:dihydropteroate synthase